MGKELKIVAFAAVVCLVCSLLLAGVTTVLRSAQETNKTLDMRVKVLTAFGLDVVDERGRRVMSPETIDQLFKEQITGHVFDREGRAVTTMSPAELTDEQLTARDASGLKAFYPVYVYTAPENGTKRYVIHISGRALWSIVKGYLALEADLSTIAGLAFYEHEETPGLGGEIETDAFQDQFKGKSLWRDGQVVRFRILKPGAALDDHSVHGITAATMTCRGVEDLVNDDFEFYNRCFEAMGWR